MQRSNFQRFYESDIFNTKPLQPSPSTLNNTMANPNKSSTIRRHANCSSLDMTKGEVFNIDKDNTLIPNATPKKTGLRHSQNYIKNTESDIFNQKSEEKPKVSKARNLINKSTCFNCMMNDNEYKENLIKYTSEKYPKLEKFNPEKYLKTESAAERYFKEIYNTKDLNQVGYKINDKKQSYAERKKLLSKQLKEENEKIGEGKVDIKSKNPKAKSTWTTNSSCNYNFVSPTQGTEHNVINSKINRHMNMESNIFNVDKKPIDLQKLREIPQNSKETQKDQNKCNKKIADKDRHLWGVYHTKWEKSNLDWKNTETEIMFKPGSGNFADKNAFQRKMYQLADSGNINTLTEQKHDDLNVKKPLNEQDKNNERLNELNVMLNNKNNITEEKRQVILQRATTSMLYNKDQNHYLDNYNPNKETVYNYEVSFKKDGKNQDEQIKKILGKNGLHIFDIEEHLDNQHGMSKLKFKIRDNDGKTEDKINDARKEFDKEPNDKITVNKVEVNKNFNKKNDPFYKKKKNGNSEDTENSKKVGHNHFTKNDFHKEFANINYKYKSKGKQ